MDILDDPISLTLDNLDSTKPRRLGKTYGDCIPNPLVI